jgi:hypothetical protein
MRKRKKYMLIFWLETLLEVELQGILEHLRILKQISIDYEGVRLCLRTAAANEPIHHLDDV